MREICTVQTIGAATYQKPVATVGVTAGWAAETAARTETDEGTYVLLQFPATDLYASPAATQALLDDSFVNLDDWLAAECEDAFAAQETQAFVNGNRLGPADGVPHLYGGSGRQRRLGPARLLWRRARRGRFRRTIRWIA